MFSLSVNSLFAGTFIISCESDSFAMPQHYIYNGYVKCVLYVCFVAHCLFLFIFKFEGNVSTKNNYENALQINNNHL